MIEKRHAVPLQFDAAKCGFGHFYYSMTPKRPELKPTWEALEQKHVKFHKYGSDVLDALMKEDYAKAKQLYEEADAYSDQLIGDLKKLKQIAEN